MRMEQLFHLPFIFSHTPFPWQVIAEFCSLAGKYQEPIAEITRKMGNGMADFASLGSVRTVKEYNLVSEKKEKKNEKKRKKTRVLLPSFRRLF